MGRIKNGEKAQEMEEQNAQVPRELGLMLPILIFFFFFF